MIGTEADDRRRRGRELQQGRREERSVCVDRDRGTPAARITRMPGRRRARGRRTDRATDRGFHAALRRLVGDTRDRGRGGRQSEHAGRRTERADVFAREPYGREGIRVSLAIGGRMIQVRHIDHVAIAVKDIAASAAWYQEMFGLERRLRRRVGRRAADDGLRRRYLRRPVPDRGRSRTGTGSRRRRDAPLRVRSSIARTSKPRERRSRSRGTDYQFADHEVAHSLYIRDPDGHRIELTTYELG